MTDLALSWKSAQSLKDLGELTARWLEGVDIEHPCYLGGGPDPETSPLVPDLVELNRSAFVTECSQPGRPMTNGSGQRSPTKATTMVIALGITLSGEKRFLGFVETDTENAPVLTLFLRALVERGLDLSQGVLVILDGGKGLRAAVRKAFRGRALVQRCQWHKRENVVSYLGKHEQVVWRQRLQRAYNRPDYNEAIGALETLHRELDERNQSAAGSLAEGLDETVTLHRLGLFGVLGRSLKTTNGLESVNALVEERCAKVDHWQNSSQRQRWLATALLDIEPRLRKVAGYRHLPKLRAALKQALKIDTTTAKKTAA